MAYLSVVFDFANSISIRFLLGCSLYIFVLLQRYKYIGGDVPIADFAKLYYNFDREQGSGLAGIFITVFIYIFTMFMAGSILYMYFLR